MRKYLFFLYSVCFSLGATSVHVDEHKLNGEQISQLKIHRVEQESFDDSSLRNIYLIYPQKIKTDEFVSASIQVKKQGELAFYANLESEGAQNNSLGSVFGIPANPNYDVTVWLSYGNKANKLITDSYIITPAEFSNLPSKTWKDHFSEETNKSN